MKVPRVVRWKKFTLLSGIAYQRLLNLVFGNPAGLAKPVPHLFSTGQTQGDA